MDYVIGDEEVRRKVKKLRVRERIDSDHHPMEIWLEGERRRKVKQEKHRDVGRIVWDEEGRNRFSEKLKEEIESREGKGIDEEWVVMEKKVKVLKEVEEEQKKVRRKRAG